MRDLLLNTISSILEKTVSGNDLNFSFFQLGGNSLRAVLLHSACKEKGIRIPITSIVSSPTIESLIESAELVFELHQPNISRTTQGAGLATPPEEQSHPAQVFEDDKCQITAPITGMQLSFLHGSEKDPGINTISYHEEYKLEHLPQMKKAWGTVVASVPIFRLAFDVTRGFQTELDTAPFLWAETVVHNRRDYQYQVRSRSFSHNDCTSFAVTLFPEDSKCTITWHIHHALIDGYSRDLVLEKVRKSAAGCSISPGGSYVTLLRDLKSFRTQRKQSATRFWACQDEKYPSPNGNLLLAPPEDATNTTKGPRTSRVCISLPGQDIQRCATQCGATFASVVHGAWALCLSRYVGSDCVEFGTILSGRSIPLENITNTVGPMINTLPFRTKVDKSLSVKEYLGRVCQQMVELVSFEWSTPEDGFSRAFTTAIALEGVAKPDIELDYPVMPISAPQADIDSDIPLHLIVLLDGTVEVKYHTASYQERDIELLIQLFCRATQSLLNPEAEIRHCLEFLFSAEHRQKLLSFGNCFSQLTRPASINQDLVTLFESAARQHPTDIACSQGDKHLTYAELDSLSALVATFLSSFIQPGDVVCLRPSSSLHWIIGIYGILKAGGVYSPLDGALPLPMQEQYFNIAAARVFLTADDLPNPWEPKNYAMSSSIPKILSMVKHGYTPMPPRTTPAPTASAYLCFTSGSSGKPKGVICTHQGLVAFQRNEEVRLFANPGRKISQIMSPAFDGSIHEIFSALSYGATLVLKDRDHSFSILGSVDSAILTPSIANILEPAHYPNLKAVYLVGEPVPDNVCKRWTSQMDVYNMYGPTEATCGATIKKLTPKEAVSLGVPQPSMRIYILDDGRSLVPLGVTGEICLAGVQVANGYVGRPAETARAFMLDPIFPDTGERMYCTGDLGYWNDKGELICLGRNDRQIKLQGFRLNLNDLETRVCKTLPEVKSIAIARKDDWLVAMVEPGSLDVSNLRSELSKILPMYAMPRHIVAVNALPRTTAGKLDYKAIAANASEAVHLERSPLNTSTALLIADIWRTLLNLDKDVVGLDQDSNFLSLGGDSLKQLRLSSMLSHHLGFQVPLFVIIRNPALGGLSRAVAALGTKESNTNFATEYQLKPLGEHGVSPAESGWYNLTTFGRSNSALNVSYVCNIGDGINRVKLAKAWNIVLARHRILASRYIEHDGIVLRDYGDQPPRAQRFKRLNVRQEINRPFALECENPIRVLISKRRMLAVIHHIVSDLTSLNILLREMVTVYQGNSLPPLTREYSDVTSWSLPAPPSSLNFWSKYLDKPEKTGFGAVISETYQGRSQVSIISPALYRDMVNFSRSFNVTLHQLALAAVSLALQYDKETIDVTLGAPLANRNSTEDLETVGLFLQPLPIRIKYLPSSSNSTVFRPHSLRKTSADLCNPSASTTPSPVPGSPHKSDDSLSRLPSFLASVSEASQAALSHAIPWAQLMNHLSKSFSHISPNHQPFDTMVSFLEYGQIPPAPLPGLDPLYVWTEGAKFKLMAEFMEVSSKTLLLRCEYDINTYCESDITRFGNKVAMALKGLVQGLDLEKVRGMVMEIANNDTDLKNNELIFQRNTSQIFAHRMNSL